MAWEIVDLVRLAIFTSPRSQQVLKCQKKPPRKIKLDQRWECNAQKSQRQFAVDFCRETIYCMKQCKFHMFCFPHFLTMKLFALPMQYTWCFHTFTPFLSLLNPSLGKISRLTIYYAYFKHRILSPCSILQESRGTCKVGFQTVTGHVFFFISRVWCSMFFSCEFTHISLVFYGFWACLFKDKCMFLNVYLSSFQGVNRPCFTTGDEGEPGSTEANWGKLGRWLCYLESTMMMMMMMMVMGMVNWKHYLHFIPLKPSVLL